MKVGVVFYYHFFSNFNISLTVEYTLINIITVQCHRKYRIKLDFYIWPTIDHFIHESFASYTKFYVIRFIQNSTNPFDECTY